MTLSSAPLEAKPSVHAAVLLLARELLGGGALPTTTAEILAVTGAGRSQAYATLARLRTAAATILASPGRPAIAPDGDATAAVVRAVRDFVMAHPGAVADTGARRRYSDAFRRFVIGLAAPGALAAELTVEQLAEAAAVPFGTLKMWLTPAAATAATSPRPAPAEPLFDSARPDIATIIALWPTWHGTFQDFCRMLRDEHRLTVGDTFVGNVLQATGLRVRKPRGRDDAPWSRGTWRDLFPGAQWLGDGTTVAVRLDGKHYVFNIEVILDPPTDAVLGVTVTDAEDEAAILATFEHAKQTAGAPPLALTLDNKPCNHAPAIVDGVAPAELLRATPGRGQAKAPLEGTFGLFAQTAPPLVVDGDTPRERGRALVTLVFLIWAWARNGKPRRQLAGRSPAAAYAEDRPSTEQLDLAKEWLAELRRRELAARETRANKADPVRRELLRDALVDLGIPDPHDRLQVALACYGTDAILRAIAVFRAKFERDTLPTGADPGRYFAGIVRNLDTRLELERMAEHLLAIRLRQRDLTLAGLDNKLDLLRAATPLHELPQALVDSALAATADIDVRFWTAAAARALANEPDPPATCVQLARRVAATFAADYQRRADLIDALTRAAASTPA